MESKKSVIVSIILFLAAVIASSLIYLLIDFHDADESVKVFGTIQLVTLCVTALLLALHMRKPKPYFLWGFYISSGLLSAIQSVPALLWILFHGQLIAERPYKAGVTAHWLYGAFHILIITWCLVNAVRYGRIHSNGSNRGIYAKSLIPIIMCICTAAGLLFGVIFGNIVIGLPAGTGIGLLIGIVIESWKGNRGEN